MRDLLSFLYRFRNTLLFLLLMGIALSMLFDGNAHHRARWINSSNAFVGDLYRMRQEVTSYANLKEVNLALAKENKDARNRHRSAYAPVESRYVRIHDSIFEQRYRYVGSRIVNSTTSKQKNYLTLDRGKDAGIRPDMGVVGSDGVIGVVSHVSEHFALVISVLNIDLQISVEVERTGHFGLLSWDTSDPRSASVIDVAEHATVKVGDRIITRGSGGLFPKGILIGIVTEVNEDPGSNYLAITIALAEDLTRSAHAYVVLDLLRDERTGLEAQAEQE